MTEEQRKAKTFLDRYKRACTEGEAAELYEEIESAIDAATENVDYRIVLKMRHLLDGITYEDMGNVIFYTARHTRRIYYEALEVFGKNV